MQILISRNLLHNNSFCDLRCHTRKGEIGGAGWLNASDRQPQENWPTRKQGPKGDPWNSPKPTTRPPEGWAALLVARDPAGEIIIRGGPDDQTRRLARSCDRR